METAIPLTPILAENDNVEIRKVSKNMDKRVRINKRMYIYTVFASIISKTVMNLERIEMVLATLSKRIYVTVALIVDGSLAIHAHSGLAIAMIIIDNIRYVLPLISKPVLVFISSSSFEPKDCPRRKYNGKIKASSMIS